MHRRNKRVLALLCALALLLPVCAPPAGAASDVIMVSFNERILPISGDTIPIWVGQRLYAPATLFDPDTAKASIGITCSQRTASVIVLASQQRALIFDLDSGTSRDDIGSVTYGGAIVRSGRVYLPLDDICTFFYSVNGLSRAYLATNVTPLLRLKNSNVGIPDDKQFIDAAEISGILQTTYNKYVQSIPEEPPVMPELPDPPAPPEKRPGVPVMLAFLCGAGEDAGSILDMLDNAGMRALFLFEPSTLPEHGEAVRRMVASGHVIGLTVSAQEEDIPARLEEGRALLHTMTRSASHLAWVPDASPAQQSALEDIGWLLWEPAVDAAALSGSAYYAANSISARLQRARDTVRLQLDDSARSSAMLALVIATLRSGEYSVVTPSETAVMG